MTTTFESLTAGDAIDGPSFAVSRESIRLFCDASLDYNPLQEQRQVVEAKDEVTERKAKRAIDAFNRTRGRR